MRISNLMATAVAAVSLFFANQSAAAGKGADDKGEYWEDASGVKHYYLFQKAGSGNRWSINYNLYSREDARDTSSSAVSWVPGSIYTLEAEAVYAFQIKNNPVATMYGIEFETLNGSSAPHTLEFGQESSRFTIGEYGINSVSGNTILFRHTGDGENIHLAASQTWSGPAAESLSSAPFVIVPNYAFQSGYRGFVGAEDDIILTIAGDIVVPWIVYDHAITNMDVVVKAPAVISLPRGSFGTGNLYTRKLTIDGGCGVKFGKDTSFIPVTGSDNNANGGAKTYGIGSVPLLDPMHVAATVVLTNGATLTALETTTVSGGVTVVSAGTAVNSFSGAFSLADDTTVVRVEDGATLDLTAATFSGSGKFSLEGAGTVKLDVAQAQYARFTGFSGSLDMPASRLVVTDESVEGAVSVANGETLLVFGDGLGPDATLTLAGGSALRFCRTATISAPVTSTGGVDLQTSDISVTGTVSSAWTGAATAASELKIDSPGLFVLAGGGTLGDKANGYDTLRMNSGNAAITGVVALYGYFRMYGGHLTIRDGGKVTISRNYRQIRMDQNTADTCLELGPGGEIETLASTSENSVYIGKGSGSYESRILLSGGNVTFNNRHYIALQAGGVVEIGSGTFKTQRRITCAASATAANARIIIRDGTYHAVGSDNYQPFLFTGPGFCTVSVEGDATLKLEGPANMPDSDGATNCTWVCTDGARLNMRGWRTDRDCTFTMHNFHADGLVFNLNQDASLATRNLDVVIADPVQDPLAVGFVLPGKSGSKIVSSGAAPDLVASYIVPDGQTLDSASLPSGWYDGFGEVSVSNLTFEAGSTIRFPAFGSAEPLSIAGRLALPETMRYAVSAVGPRCALSGAQVIVPALGTTGEDCAFTCAGGVTAASASVETRNGAVVFSYAPRGTIFLLR